ncbi:Prephenate dehydratase-domain-containing protein [Nemania sp. FL0031]|nr:Prephenate dehydratase-domain-containing protein [Nemania sp. FL0031]
MEANEQVDSSSTGSKPVVCFLGPVSSYTHQATMQRFPSEQFDLMPVTTIKDIFDTTQSGAATYGVVPFENSTNGSVVFTLDHFADRANVYKDLNVCQEIYLDVHHCLLGHIAPSSSSPLETTTAKKEESSTGTGEGQRARPLHPISHVRRVYSHPQAFGQCTAFLGSWLRGIETVDVSSTSRAAELALADASGESAAISSAAAAALLGLDVLARNIEDRADNTTRFFVLRRGVAGGPSSPSSTSTLTPTPTSSSSTINTAAKPKIEGREGQGDGKEEGGDEDDAHLLASTKSLLSFTVPHRSPGALADVLSCFRRGGLNLTSINSRPSLAGAGFEYIFFVEFEGHRFRDSRGRVARVLQDVAAVARTSRWLGSWENMRRDSA